MADKLLTTKLHIPSLRKGFVTRPRLVEKCCSGVEPGAQPSQKHTLISAPAGFGKTTILLEWLQQADLPIAWLSLDEGDNDLDRFFTYLVTALQKIDEGSCQSVLGLLQTPQEIHFQSLVTALINDIPSDPFVLVLDDFHHLNNKIICQAIGYLLENQPSHMHLVISTRRDPPFSFAKLRAQGQMTELRADDLRFVRRKSCTFLNGMMGLDLSAAEIDILHTRTEGWVAGLQLASISLASYSDPNQRTTFIQEFAGDNRHIMDYLMNEVLSRQSEEVREFLLHTAFLERFCGPLCDAVVYDSEAQGASQTILEDIEMANLFIVPLDHRRQWYRYHHLFADLLKHRLRKSPDAEETIRILRLRTSEWFEREGLLDEAVQYALVAEEFERAAFLIEPVVIDLIFQSRLSTVMNWLAKLPAELVVKHPWFSISFSWASLLTGKMLDAEQHFQNAEAHLSGISPQTSEDDNRIRGHIITIRAFLARWKGDLQHSMELSQEASTLVDRDNDLAGSGLALNFGNLYFALGDHVSSLSHYQEAFKIGQLGGAYYPALIALTNMADIHRKLGHLQQAAEICRQAIQFGTKWGGGQPLPATGQALLRLGNVFFEWNDLEEALVHFKRGIELGKFGGETFIILKGTLDLVLLNLSQGDITEASRMFERAQKIHSEAHREQESGELVGLQARIWLAQGNMGAAALWASKLIQNIDGELDYQHYQEHLSLARVLIGLGKPDEALVLLERLLVSAEEHKSMGEAIEILAIQALALQAQGYVDQAARVITRSLSLAEPEGYIRTFVDEGPAMARLLYEILSRGMKKEYVGKLLAAFPTLETTEPASQEQLKHGSVTIEALSERELEVLRLIADGFSNQEIAQELVLALDTVKGHTRKIYGKFGVHSRTQAVAIARTLGLLPPK